VDASGQVLALSRPPRRIVSLIPSTTETLCALGLAEVLVGVTVYCIEPRDVVRTKTRIGGEKNPDLDAIRRLAPDLVIANIEENLREHVMALRASGITVWVTYPRTVRDAIRMIRELGDVTGATVPATALADELDRLYDDVTTAAAKREPVTVFYAIWRGPYMTIARDTYIHDMLTICGGRNVFGERPERYPTVTLDEIAVARPAVIVLPDEQVGRAHV